MNIRRALGLVALAATVARLRTEVIGRSPTTWTPPQGEIRSAGLAVRVLGDGEPRIALLHGMFNSGAYWGGAYDVLTGAGQVLVPDLLGFGRSPRPASGYTPDDHADAVADTLRAVGVRAPIIVAGHSLGSVVALRLAMRHPDLVAGLVAVAPPLYPDITTAERRVAGTDPLARILLSNETLGRWLCDWMCRFPRASSLLVRIVRPSMPAALAADRVQHSWVSYSETLSSVLIRSGASAWLDEIDVPVRLIAGTKDAAVELGFLQELSRIHPNVELLTVEEAGHDLPLSHPDICLVEIRRMLGGGGRHRSPNEGT